MSVPAEIVAAARASEAKWGIPASVILAQWALESGWGASVSGKHNYGGITARVRDARFPYEPGVPLEPATLCPTHEEVDGEEVPCKRWFKDFPSDAAYFDYHGKLLATSDYYAKARAALPDADAFADALTGVYATASSYGETLKQIMHGRTMRRALA